MHDACFNSVMQSYGKWSARAAQAVAKCRKKSGHVRKSAAGLSLKRWQQEKWKDKRTGKACGAGGSTQYCRPSKKISNKTPAMPRGQALKKAIRQKVNTCRAPVIHKRKK